MDQTPSKILSRQRELYTAEVTGNSVLTPTLTLLNPVHALLNDSSNALVIKNFANIHSDLKIKIMLTAPATTAGAIFVGYYYGLNTSVAATLEVRNHVTSMRHWILDPSTADALEFDIPFKHHFPWYNIPTYKSDTTAPGPRIVVGALRTHSAMGGAAKVGINIYGSFSETVKLDKYYKENMMIARPDTRSLAMGGTITTALGISRALYDMYTPTVYAVGQGLKTAGKVADTASKTLDTVKETAGAVSGAVKSVGGQMTKSINSIADMFPSLPSSGGRADHAPVKQNFYGDIARTAAVDSSNLLEPTIPHIRHTVSGIPMRSYSLQELVSIPSMCTIFEYASSTTVGTIVDRKTISAAGGQGVSPYSWGSYYARFFRFVRTDHVFFFVFKCTELVRSRVKISYSYDDDYTTNSAGTNVVWGVYDIKGPQMIPIYIPYVSQKPVMDINEIMASLKVELLQPPTSVGTGTTYVTVLTYHSLVNSHFYSPKCWTPASEVNVLKEPEPLKVTENMDIRGLMDEFQIPKVAQPVETIDYMEQVLSLDTIFHRYDNEPVPTLDPVIDLPPSTKIGDNVNFKKAAFPFAFYAGSHDVKIQSTSTAPEKDSFGVWLGNNTNFPNTASSIANGAALTSRSVWNFVDVFIPWIAEASCDYMQNTGTFAPDIISGVTNIDLNTEAVVLKRAGPDFAVHYANILPTSSAW